MPSIEAIASSTRTHTPSSASAGEAPRYGTRMVMMSVSNSGKTSIRLAIDSSPAATDEEHQEVGRHVVGGEPRQRTATILSFIPHLRRCAHLKRPHQRRCFVPRSAHCYRAVQ